MLFAVRLDTFPKDGETQVTDISSATSFIKTTLYAKDAIPGLWSAVRGSCSMNGARNIPRSTMSVTSTEPTSAGGVLSRPGSLQSIQSGHRAHVQVLRLALVKENALAPMALLHSGAARTAGIGPPSQHSVRGPAVTAPALKASRPTLQTQQSLQAGTRRLQCHSRYRAQLL